MEDRMDDRVRLAVFDHKTGDQQTAILLLSRQLYQMLEVFRIHIRPQVTGPEGLSGDNDTLFVKFSKANGCFSARSLDHSRDSTTINRWIRRLAPANATELRKASTIRGRTANPEVARPLARFLCHTDQTADRHYNLGQRIRDAPIAHTVIANAMGSGMLLDEQWRTGKHTQGVGLPKYSPPPWKNSCGCS